MPRSLVFGNVLVVFRKLKQKSIKKINHLQTTRFLHIYNYFCLLEGRKMSSGFSRKGWTEQENQIIRAMIQNDSDGSVRWIDVSTAIFQQTGKHRTGKQCRQRWQHQLKPSIVRKQWNQVEVITLFQKQQEFGNKWALIADFLPGRTDNAVKNYFYSSVRKVLTTINIHLSKLRKYKQFKTIRYFQSDYLSKLMAVVDGNFDKRVRLTCPEAQNTAKNILNKISKLVLNQASGTNSVEDQQLNSMILTMQQFRKKCIKRKHVNILQEQNQRQAEPHKQIKQNSCDRDAINKQSAGLQLDRDNQYLHQNHELQSNKTLQSAKIQTEQSNPTLYMQKSELRVTTKADCFIQAPGVDISKVVQVQNKDSVWNILEGQFFFNGQSESMLFDSDICSQGRSLNAFGMPDTYLSQHRLSQRFEGVQQILKTKILEANMAFEELRRNEKKILVVQQRNL